MPFHYDLTTFTIRDDKRGLVVTQTAGPGHGIYAGLMEGEDWAFRFVVNRYDDAYPREITGEQLLIPIERDRLKNPDYRVRLQVRVQRVKGRDLPTDAAELAREAALARELEFFKTEPWRVTTN